MCSMKPNTKSLQARDKLEQQQRISKGNDNGNGDDGTVFNSERKYY